MLRRTLRGFAVLAVLALVAAACGDDDDDDDAGGTATSGADATGGTEETGGTEDTTDTVTETSAAGGGENTASDTGVTEDTIKVVVMGADLSGLVQAGVISGVPENSHEINARRYTWYFDQWNAEGGINGRMIEYETVTWDPADPASYDEACSQITLDIQPFMVLNPGGGFNTDTIPCITADGDTMFFALDPVGLSTHEASGTNLVNLAPPSEILADAGTQAAIDGGYLADDASVAILAGDQQFQVDATASVMAALEEAGIEVVYDDPVNTAQQPADAIVQNVRLAVPEMQQAGADHVIVMLPFTQAGAFPAEAQRSGFEPEYVLLEIASGTCYAFAAAAYPAEYAGASCVTATDNNRLDDQLQVREDTPFEAECREEFEAARNEFPSDIWVEGEPSVIGTPFGGVTDAEGTHLNEDQPYFECGYIKAIRAGLEGAGADLTHESLWAALATLSSFDLAGYSNGQGSFAEDKPWAATAVHVVEFVPGDPEALPDESGLYGECLIPRNCFHVVTPETWSPIERTLAG